MDCGGLGCVWCSLVAWICICVICWSLWVSFSLLQVLIGWLCVFAFILWFFMLGLCFCGVVIVICYWLDFEG